MTNDYVQAYDGQMFSSNLPTSYMFISSFWIVIVNIGIEM